MKFGGGRVGRNEEASEGFFDVNFECGVKVVLSIVTELQIFSGN